MPFVRIDVIKDSRDAQELRRIGDVIHEVLTQTFNAPPRDRYQVLTTIPNIVGMMSFD